MTVSKVINVMAERRRKFLREMAAIGECIAWGSDPSELTPEAKNQPAMYEDLFVEAYKKHVRKFLKSRGHEL